MSKKKENKNVQNSENKDLDSTSQSILHTDTDKRLTLLARVMTAIELKDDHSLDINIAKNVELLKEMDTALNFKENKFLGILSKCRIVGCDVHALNNELQIIKHFKANEQIDECFIKARTIAANMSDSVIAILVFDTHCTLLYMNGKMEISE